MRSPPDVQKETDMAPASDLPLALWKANLDLQLRIGRLVQDSQREWLDIGIRAVGEGASELDAETRALWRSGDWQALAALPVEALWRQMEQRVADGQALAQVTLGVQDAFARGLVEALQDWQKDTATALAGSGKAPDAASALRAMFGPWLAFQSAFVPPGGRRAGARED